MSWIVLVLNPFDTFCRRIPKVLALKLRFWLLVITICLKMKGDLVTRGVSEGQSATKRNRHKPVPHLRFGLPKTGETQLPRALGRVAY